MVSSKIGPACQNGCCKPNPFGMEDEVLSKVAAVISHWQANGLAPWAALLEPEVINEAFAQARAASAEDGGPLKRSLDTAATTLWVFLSQCLSANERILSGSGGPFDFLATGGRTEGLA